MFDDYEKARELDIGDLEAAKHLYYWTVFHQFNVSKNASPADLLQISFIKRRHDEVRQTIQYINHNDCPETIPDEAARLTAAGLNLYTHFPYHRQVYAY